MSPAAAWLCTAWLDWDGQYELNDISTKKENEKNKIKNETTSSNIQIDVEMRTRDITCDMPLFNALHTQFYLLHNEKSCLQVQERGALYRMS